MHLWQRHPVLRHTLRVLGLLVAFVALLYAKTAYNARQDFALGEESYTHGEYKVAITHYERAIKWYTPLSPVLLWSIVVELGFLGWVGAPIGLIWYVVDEQGNFVRPQGLL